MIKRIKRIKKLGLVFADYKWNCHLSGYQLPDFKRYNLIYGWTGTGKTTLSALFGAIQSPVAKRAPELIYEFEDNQGTQFTQTNSFATNIRVFNEDYVEDNLKIRESKAKAITLVLGDANKDIVEQIESDNKELEKGDIALKAASATLERKKKTKGKTFTEIAKTIYIAIVGGAIRNYRKDNAESDFVLLKAKELLADNELGKCAKVVKQTPLPLIDDIVAIKIATEQDDERELHETVRDLVKNTTVLMSQTVESQVIDRLRDNQDIANWVETGLTVHAEHKSTKCEFCGQQLPKDRQTELLKHFNEADKHLKSEIDNIIEEWSVIRTTIDNIGYPDKARFYDEFQEDYEKDCLEVDSERTNLSGSIVSIIDALKDKKAKTTVFLELDIAIDVLQFVALHNKISAYIDLPPLKRTG